MEDTENSWFYQTARSTRAREKKQNKIFIQLNSNSAGRLHGKLGLRFCFLGYRSATQGKSLQVTVQFGEIYFPCFFVLFEPHLNFSFFFMNIEKRKFRMYIKRFSIIFGCNEGGGRNRIRETGKDFIFNKFIERISNFNKQWVGIIAKIISELDAAVPSPCMEN